MSHYCCKACGLRYDDCKCLPIGEPARPPLVETRPAEHLDIPADFKQDLFRIGQRLATRFGFKKTYISAGFNFIESVVLIKQPPCETEVTLSIRDHMFAERLCDLLWMEVDLVVEPFNTFWVVKFRRCPKSFESRLGKGGPAKVSFALDEATPSPEAAVWRAVGVLTKADVRHLIYYTEGYDDLPSKGQVRVELLEATNRGIYHAVRNGA